MNRFYQIIASTFESLIFIVIGIALVTFDLAWEYHL
jgi:hypothetical protein